MGWFVFIGVIILAWLLFMRFAGFFTTLLVDLAFTPSTIGGKLIGLAIAIGLAWGFLKLVATVFPA